VADYAITLARSASRELEALSTALVERIFPKIEALATQPQALSDFRKLSA